MQQQVGQGLQCYEHGENIISVPFKETGENQILCKKCLAPISVEQLTQQLTDLKSKNLQISTKQVKKSEKRLGSLNQLFLIIKEQFNQQIDRIIITVSDRINLMNKIIKQESEKLSQPIKQLTIDQINTQIIELKKELQDDFQSQGDDQLKNQMIEQYLELIDQLNDTFKQFDWKKINDEINYQEIARENPLQLTQYQEFIKEEGVFDCYAMTIDKEEKILVIGQQTNIQIWDFNQNGTIKLKQSLNGHTDNISTLRFSQIKQWFISGGHDNTIKIWKRDSNDNFICQQTIENAHKHWIYDIILNNEDDQFISCSQDKTIKVWMIQNDGCLWECVQTLTEDTDCISYLSFSLDFKLFASCGNDALRIWKIQKDKKWKLLWGFAYHNNDKPLRIQFIDKNEFIASTCNQGNLLKYTQNKEGIFELKSELKLNELKEQRIYFPMIYNKLLGLAILRHSNYIYILKQQEAGEFLIHQVLNGDYSIGYLLSNGKFLILHDNQKNCLEVLKQ